MLSPETVRLEQMQGHMETLIPELGKRVRTIGEAGLAEQDLQLLADAELFDILKPAAFGGLEMPWGSHLNFGRTLAATCAPSAWFVSVIGGNAYLVARMSPAAQADVWGGNRIGLVSVAPIHATALLQSEGDGYRLTGTWRYVEGAALVDWILVAVCRPDNVDGYALIPSDAFESTPADHPGGLRGVGVYGLSVRDLSVPAHRTIGATELFGIGETSSAVLPYWEFQVLAPLLGCAEGAYHNYTSSTRKRVGGTTNAAVARFTQVQQRLAEVSARIKSARLLYEESMHLLMSRRVEGKVLTREEALELARDRSFIAGLCQTAIRDLVRQMGAIGIAEFNPVQRQYRDIHAMATYHTIRARHNMAEYGKHELGIPSLKAPAAPHIAVG